jgi:hypothetical protein
MGSSPKVPAPPGLSPEEKDILGKQGVTLDQVNAILKGETDVMGQNRDALRGLSGLYDENGNLNPAALDDLRTRMMNEQKMGGDISSMQGQQVLQALRGERPVGAAQLESERQEYQNLVANAASRGIRILGNDIMTATSDSTAGNQLIANLRRNADISRQNERQNAINSGFTNLLSSMGLGTSSQLNMLGNSMSMSPANLIGAGANVAQGYGQMLQPYQNQRQLAYQAQVQNAMNKQNPYAAALGGAASGAMMGGVLAAPTGGMSIPVGAAIGGGLGLGSGFFA